MIPLPLAVLTRRLAGGFQNTYQAKRILRRECCRDGAVVLFGCVILLLDAVAVLLCQNCNTPNSPILQVAILAELGLLFL